MCPFSRPRLPHSLAEAGLPFGAVLRRAGHQVRTYCPGPAPMWERGSRSALAQVRIRDRDSQQPEPHRLAPFGKPRHAPDAGMPSSGVPSVGSTLAGWRPQPRQPHLCFGHIGEGAAVAASASRLHDKAPLPRTHDEVGDLGADGLREGLG